MADTAFFYQKPTLLDREQHKNLKISPVTDFGFAKAASAVPLLGVEFPEACLEYPIIFIRAADGAWVALAVTGLADGENLFVDERGRWIGRFIPSSVRRYPFILADKEGEPGQFNVAIDTGSANVGDAVAGGEALFDEAGEPLPLLRNVLTMLSDFQGQALATQAFIGRLADAGLLIESNIQIAAGDGNEATLSGSWIVDENRLRGLADATAAAWFRSGDLALIYGHLLSLRNLLPLLQRKAAAGSVSTAATSAE